MKKKLLKEQEAVIPVREITNDEKSRLETFQEVLVIIHDYFSIQRPSLKQYQNFRDRIEPYFDQPYMYKVERMINNIDSELESVEEAIPKREENIKQLESQVKDIEDDFFDGNIESAHEKAQKTKTIRTSIKKSFESKTEKVQQKNPFRVAPETLFQTLDLIKSGFELEDMERLSNLDLDTYKYTYLKWPDAKEDDFQYIVYFMQKLQNTLDPVTIKGDEYNKFAEFLYQGDPEWEKLKKMVEKYLHTNEKSMIPKIMNGLQKFDSLVKMNEKQKQEIRTVYRGIGGGGEPPSEKEIIEKEKEQRYVATSKQERAATNFAYERGHLEQGRRSEWGYIIVYAVNPDAILLDTAIFGSIFGESEVLIDVRNAKAKDMYLI